MVLCNLEKKEKNNVVQRKRGDICVLCEEDASHWTFVYTYTTLIESR